MFFRTCVNIVYGLIILLNGRVKVYNKENLPTDDTYVLIAPHRSWMDPVFIAIASRPRKFVAMAKKELFNYPVFSWFIKTLGAFPVDREKPGPSAIKTPVKAMKNTDRSTLIFPSGTRHSKELKGGAITIAKLSKKPIVPAVYIGPYTFKDLLKRQQTHVIIGEPFDVKRKIDGVDDVNDYYNDKIQKEFDQLEADLKEKIGQQ